MFHILKVITLLLTAVIAYGSVVAFVQSPEQLSKNLNLPYNTAAALFLVTFLLWGVCVFIYMLVAFLRKKNLHQ